jgi:hypothetical protein
MTSRAPIAVLLAATAAVLAACGGAVSSPSAAGQLGHGAEAFPPGIVAFADVDADTGSAAWKKVDTLLGRFPGWPAAQTQLEQKLAETSSDGSSFNTSIKPWLGDEAAIGLYGVTISAGKPAAQWAAYIASKDDGKAAAAITTGKNPATKTGTYKGYDEYKTTSGDTNLVAAIGNNALLVSSDQATLQQSIDAREGGAQLAGEDAYKQTLQKLPSDSVAIAFVDWQKVSGLLQLALAAAGSQTGGAAAAAQLGPMLAQLQGVQALGFSAGATDAGFQISSAVVGTLPTPSGAVTLLGSLPANSLAAFDSVGADATSTQLGTYLQNPQVATALDQLKQRTGIDVATDLPPLLTGEIAAYAAPGTPVSGAILLKPKDPDAATAALDRIVAGLEKGGMPAPKPLPDGAHGGIVDVGSTQISWRRDGDVITIGYQTGGAATVGGLASAPDFQRTASAAGMQGDQPMVLYANVPAIAKLANPPAEAQPNLAALGGLLAWTSGEASTLFLEVPPPAS